MTTEPEIEVMQLQAKQCVAPPETGRDKEKVSLRNLGRSAPLLTL